MTNNYAPAQILEADLEDYVPHQKDYFLISNTYKRFDAAQIDGCGHKWLVETDTGTQGRGEIFWTSPTSFDRTPD